MFVAHLDAGGWDGTRCSTPTTAPDPPTHRTYHLPAFRATAGRTFYFATTADLVVAQAALERQAPADADAYLQHHSAGRTLGTRCALCYKRLPSLYEVTYTYALAAYSVDGFEHTGDYALFHIPRDICRGFIGRYPAHGATTTFTRRTRRLHYGRFHVPHLPGPHLYRFGTAAVLDARHSTPGKTGAATRVEPDYGRLQNGKAA